MCFLRILGPHDVRIRMKAVGICGSDVHYLKVNTIQLALSFLSVLIYDILIEL